MQTSHVHAPGAFVGIFIPAATQLKPPLVVVGTGLGGSNTAAPLVVEESGRGSSHATHLSLAESLLTMQVPHVHEPVAFAGGFIPAASQLKADLTPKMNENTGREDGSAAKAVRRSLSCFDEESVVGRSKKNDGSDAESSESAASFASLGTDFATDCDSVLELGIRALATSRLGAGASQLAMAGAWGFFADGGSCGCAGAGRSYAGLAGGGESGSLSAAKPKRSLDGSLGADDLSGNGGLGVAPTELPFAVGVVFLALG